MHVFFYLFPTVWHMLITHFSELLCPCLLLLVL